MTQVPDWVPPDVDLTKPSMARVYDYMLGGAHNFVMDREIGDQIKRAMPGIQHAARVNRAFLRRAVRFMVTEGVRQFLDIGSGIPTVGNVHEIAQQADPSCRVVYVDRDPVAVAHSQLLLAGNENATVIRADMTEPDAIFGSPELPELLDLDQPVGLLMLLMLHWVPDEEDPAGLLTRYRDALASGSYLAITHVTDDYQDEETLTGATDVVKQSRSRDQMNPRPRAEVRSMFGDFELVEPGLVACAMWRSEGRGDISDDPAMNALMYAGVGRKS